MIDPVRFPVLRAYVDQLPNGLDSHPDYVAKASLYRTVVDATPLAPDDVEALPDVLRSLIQHPLPVSSWIPEAHSHGVMLAVYDSQFGDAGRFEQWAYDRQRDLFSGPLYSVAMKLVSPNLLLKTATLRWRLFHRGVTFKVTEQRNDGGVGELQFPTGVYEDISLLGMCAGLRAALDLTVGGGCRVGIRDASATHAVVAVNWPPR